MRAKAPPRRKRVVSRLQPLFSWWTLVPIGAEREFASLPQGWYKSRKGGLLSLTPIGSQVATAIDGGISPLLFGLPHPWFGSIWSRSKSGPAFYLWEGRESSLLVEWSAICATPEMHIDAHIAADIGSFIGELFGFVAVVAVVALFGGVAGGKSVNGGRRWEWD
jgi:hypothetical protein